MPLQIVSVTDSGNGGSSDYFIYLNIEGGKPPFSIIVYNSALVGCVKSSTNTLTVNTCVNHIEAVHWNAPNGGPGKPCSNIPYTFTITDANNITRSISWSIP